jgi:hypothetical protein
MQNQINTTPITQFIQQVRSAELSQSKEVKLSIQQARMISMALTELMEKVLRDYETMLNQLKKSAENEVVNVELDGGGFEEPK